MSQETPEQKKMREHYQKLYDDAIARGPLKFEDLSQSLKDYFGWQYCQIQHVENAVGGPGNFRHWVTTIAEDEFRHLERAIEIMHKLVAIAPSTGAVAGTGVLEFLKDYEARKHKEEEDERLREEKLRKEIKDATSAQ